MKEDNIANSVNLYSMWQTEVINAADPIRPGTMSVGYMILFVVEL